MRFGQRVIYFQSLPGGRLRFRNALLRRGRGVIRKYVVTVCQTGVSQRKARVLFDRLIEILYRLLQRVCVALVPIESSPEVRLIGLIAVGVFLRDPFFV